MSSWLLLHYKLPSKPTALRVYVWRKLKRLGAILLDDTVWVLPDTPKTAEQFQWLLVEIQDMKGDVILWRSTLVLGRSEDSLLEQFRQQVEMEYRALLKQLGHKNPNLPKLSQDYQQVAARDYFRSDAGMQVKEKLVALRGKTE